MWIGCVACNAIGCRNDNYNLDSIVLTLSIEFENECINNNSNNDLEYEIMWNVYSNDVLVSNDVIYEYNSDDLTLTIDKSTLIL